MVLTVENCTSLSISILQKAINRLISLEHPDIDPKKKYTLILKELKKFTANDQTFEYDSINNYLGGYRWFFLCPKCKSRATKLFLPPPKAIVKEHRYLCKNCHKLKNQSAMLGQNKIFQKVTKPLKRMQEIQNRISRGHLKPEKINELLLEHDKIEKELKTTPEYRLYAFKKKYDL